MLSSQGNPHILNGSSTIEITSRGLCSFESACFVSFRKCGRRGPDAGRETLESALANEGGGHGTLSRQSTERAGAGMRPAVKLLSANFSGHR